MTLNSKLIIPLFYSIPFLHRFRYLFNVVSKYNAHSVSRVLHLPILRPRPPNVTNFQTPLPPMHVRIEVYVKPLPPMHVRIEVYEDIVVRFLTRRYQDLIKQYEHVLISHFARLTCLNVQLPRCVVFQVFIIIDFARVLLILSETSVSLTIH